jgi:hypothetical protein
MLFKIKHRTERKNFFTKTIKSSSPQYTLSNNTTSSQTQTGVIVPLSAKEI